MSDSEHRDAIRALMRQGLDGAAMVRALVELNEAPGRPEAERLGHARATALMFAQATLDYLLELAAVGPRCTCGHPQAWHASFSPRRDGPALGRCSPPASIVRLTNAGGLAVDRGVQSAAGADARMRLGRPRPVACACRAFEADPTGSLREGLGARHLAHEGVTGFEPLCEGPVLGNETVTTDRERFGELERDCAACAAIRFQAARAERGSRGRFVRRGRGPEPDEAPAPEP